MALGALEARLKFWDFYGSLGGGVAKPEHPPQSRVILAITRALALDYVSILAQS